MVPKTIYFYGIRLKSQKIIMSLEFPERLRQPSENDEHWERRKKFLLWHREKFLEDRLACLSQVYTNFHFLGCSYSKAVMQKIADLGKEIESNPIAELGKEIEPNPIAELGKEIEPNTIAELGKEIEPNPIAELGKEIKPNPDAEATTEEGNLQEKGKHKLDEANPYQQKMYKFMKQAYQSRFVKSKSKAKSSKRSARKTNGDKSSNIAVPPKVNLEFEAKGLENGIPKLLEQFSHLISVVKEKESVPIQIIHICAGKLQVKVKRLFERKRVNNVYHFNCSLYVKNILIGKGTAGKKRDAQNEAYMRAMEKLSVTTQPCDSKVTSIINKIRARQKLDKQQNISSVANKNVKSNSHNVIIILDDLDINPKMNSLGILMRVSSFNNIPVEVKCEQDSYNMNITCSIEWEHSLIATAVGKSKQDAKIAASEIALSKIRKKAYTVKIKEHTAANVISKQKLNQCISGNAIQEDNIGYKLLQMMGWKDDNKNKCIAISRANNPYRREGLGFTPSNATFLSQVEKVIANYASSGKDEDLVFTSEFSKEERAQIQRFASKYLLKSASIGGRKDRHMVLSRKFTSSQLFDYLIKNGGETSKFLLIPPK